MRTPLFLLAAIALSVATAEMDEEKLIATLDEARQRAKALKSRPPFSEAVMQVNPKIDGSQRRLQCSLRFADFFDHLAPDAERGKQEQPKVFGVAVPRRFDSAPRTITPEK